MKYDEKLVKDIINCISDGIARDPEFFGINVEDDYFHMADVIGNELDKCGIAGCINYGVSKCVIVPEKTDVVIKTPFRGQFEYIYNEELDNLDYDDAEFNHFHQANIDTWDEAETDWDYCENELIKYERAVEAGFGMFYAETAWFDTLDGQPYYIQEKVIPFYDAVKRIPSEDSNIKYNSSHMEDKTRLDKTWLCVAIDMYGLDKVNDFIQYLEYTKTYDLHRHNYGYTLTGAPVLLDWSGWRDSLS